MLILDEAVSILDALIEPKVQNWIKKESDMRTTLIMAQRPSNYISAGVIIVIHEGKIP